MVSTLALDCFWTQKLVQSVAPGSNDTRAGTATGPSLFYLAQWLKLLVWGMETSIPIDNHLTLTLCPALIVGGVGRPRRGPLVRACSRRRLFVFARK